MNKLNWKLLTALSIILISFTACDDDDYYVTGNNWISYGNLEKVEGSARSEFIIHRDDNSRLIAVDGINLNNLKAEDGTRVCYTYSILDSKRQPQGLEGNIDYYIYLSQIEDVLTKSPINESFINENPEHRQDSIGNDPINVREAWFGGKYLNVEFNLPVKGDSKISHMINLVREDVTLHQDTVYLTLRHNAYGDRPSTAGVRSRGENFFWVWGNVSFDLTDILPEGKTSVPVKLIWEAYKGNTQTTETLTDCGLFTMQPQKSKAVAGGLNAEPKNLKNERSTAICR